MQRVLVLNQDFTFLGVSSWQNSVCAVYSGKAIVESEYDEEIHSPSVTMRIPAVIRLKKYVKILYDRITFISYTKRNVHLRDNWTCLYCGKKCERGKLGIDHVIPESRGGLTNWENTCSCCHSCNLIKDNRTPEEASMHLLKIPGKPKGFKQILKIKLGEIHELWYRYLEIENEKS